MLFQFDPDYKKIQTILQRNKMLDASDWTQMPDADLTPEIKQAWATYRQELRDITKKEGFPDVELPVSPASPDYLK